MAVTSKSVFHITQDTYQTQDEANGEMDTCMHWMKSRSLLQYG